MKRLLILILGLAIWQSAAYASDPLADEWSRISGGSKGADWYGSQEAVSIADTLLAVQKVSGGWGKNLGYHCLSATELAELKATVDERSCLDNWATYNEMRYLARVWKQTGEERFRTSFLKALNMLFKAEKIRGGWSQYYPIYNNGSYVDFITYNDNLMVNVMRMLHDVYLNTGIYAEIADEATRSRCLEAFERNLALTLKLQIDDNGVKAGWCAQYDPADFAACWARRFEPPSVSGYEGFSLLSFLMSLPHPSRELQEAIIAAVDWYDKHKIEDKALEEFVNDAGEKDFRIIDKPGHNLWGRFIQLGGESGKKMYDKFFAWLRQRNKSHSYTYEGVTYTYTEIEGVKASYREDMAYQPIYSSHRDDQPHMDYRFMYNYEDTPFELDKNGCPVFTSLTAFERTAYCYLGDWGDKVLYADYPVWKQNFDLMNLGGEDAKCFEISGDTFVSAEATDYQFADGVSVSNTKDKTYQNGNNSTVKFSASTPYTISLPEGSRIGKMVLYGYDNYDVDAYVKELNGKTFGPEEYVFPAKIDGSATYATHIFDFSDAPVSDHLTFTLGSKQCCLKIYLFEMPSSGVKNPSIENNSCKVFKLLKDGEVIISTPEGEYSLGGTPR